MNAYTKLAVTCLGLSLCVAVSGCGGEEKDKPDDSNEAAMKSGGGSKNSEAVSGLFEPGSDPGSESSTPPLATTQAANPNTGETAGGSNAGADSGDGSTVSFLGLVGPRADTWEPYPPTDPNMRAANYIVRGSGGDAEIVVFIFRSVGGGPKQMNIDRWIGQFSTKSMDPGISEFEANGMAITLVELAGTYEPGMGRPPRDNQHFLSAIVEAPGIGNVYIRLVGPDATVMENKAAFMAMLNNLKPAG